MRRDKTRLRQRGTREEKVKPIDTFLETMSKQKARFGRALQAVKVLSGHQLKRLLNAARRT